MLRGDTHTHTHTHGETLMELRVEAIHLSHTHTHTRSLLHCMSAIRVKVMECTHTHTHTHTHTLISLFVSELVNLIGFAEKNSPRSLLNQQVLIRVCVCVCIHDISTVAFVCAWHLRIWMRVSGSGSVCWTVTAGLLQIMSRLLVGVVFWL